MSTRDELVEALLILRDEPSLKAYDLRILQEAADALQAQGWRGIETLPKDGRAYHVWADGFEWPEVVRWATYSPEDAEEAGEVGYWTYAEDLLAEVTDSCEPDQWSHWQPLPPPPTLGDPG